MKKLQARNDLLWMNGEILHNIKKKYSFRKRIRRSRSPSQHLKDRFRDIRKRLNKCYAKVGRTTSTQSVWLVNKTSNAFGHFLKPKLKLRTFQIMFPLEQH